MATYEKKLKNTRVKKDSQGSYKNLRAISEKCRMTDSSYAAGKEIGFVIFVLTIRRVPSSITREIKRKRKGRYKFKKQR